MTSVEFIDELARATKEQIAAVVSPLLARIAVLEAKAAEPLDIDGLAAKAAVLVPRPEPARDGRDADPVDLDMVVAKVAALIPVPTNGRDGKDATVDLDLVAAKAAALIPKPADGKDGKDATVDLDALAQKAAQLVPRPDLEPLVVSTVDRAVKAIPMPKDGRDGRDVDAALLETIVSSCVERVLAEWPKPKDGVSLTPDDIAPLIKSEVQQAVAAWPKPKDGVGILDAVVTHDGALALTFSDGRRTNVGPVVGPAGKDADMAALQKQVSDEVARIPKPKDGVDGKDGAKGADGLGFEDLDVVVDDEQCLLRWSRDGQVKEAIVPVVLDRGVYRPGVLYRKGAAVTAQGSLWIAQADTRERPGDGSTLWRLAVKKGRDGKDLRSA